MGSVKEYLPFLIPLIIAQFALLGLALRHILTHQHYRRGTRTMWLVVCIVLMEFIGPILYFALGREDD